MIKTYDDVLPEPLLDFIRFEVDNLSFRKHTSTREMFDKGIYFFASVEENLLSHRFLFNIFCQKYNLPNKDVKRSYTNCYPPLTSGEFHEDDGDQTFLFFPDKTENKKGGTSFLDGTTIEYKTNRLIIFDASLPHKADKNESNQMRHSIAWKTLI